MVPLYHESYWIPCNVNDTLGQSYFRMLRSRFCSHHMPIMLMFFPLQRHKESEGGPPCNSMPLGAAWAYYIKVLILASTAS